jgi:di/tricarboxylate transporter
MFFITTCVENTAAASLLLPIALQLASILILLLLLS